MTENVNVQQFLTEGQLGLLFAIPSPKYSDFTGWDEFEAHLDSLEELLPDLRVIDQLAAKL